MTFPGDKMPFSDEEPTANEAPEGFVPPASAKPSLLLVRARANEAARKLVPAAKDYQTLYYKFPFSDESKDAAIALPRLKGCT